MVNLLLLYITIIITIHCQESTVNLSQFRPRNACQMTLTFTLVLPQSPGRSQRKRPGSSSWGYPFVEGQLSFHE